jgi:hypothetical protein
MEITVPTENIAPTTPATQEMEITVPTENTAPTTPATEQLEITVPTENTAPTTPATQDEFIIEDSKAATKQTEDFETIEIEDTRTETPTQEVEEFIIEEDNDDKKKKSTRDLEDEYFELDGF